MRRILAELGQTAIHVTHDHSEPFALADTVALMREGRIHRAATPQQLRDDPQDAGTATFLGLGTIWDLEGGVAQNHGAMLTTPWGPLELPPVASGDGGSDDRSLCLLIRRDAIRPGGPTGVTAEVSDVRTAGDRTVATFEVPGAPPLSGYVPANVVVGRHYRITLDQAGVLLVSRNR